MQKLNIDLAMENLLRFVDRQGQYKEMHVISIHYIIDQESEELMIEMSGIDDSIILSLSSEYCLKLGIELSKARSFVEQLKERRKRLEKQRRNYSILRDKVYDLLGRICKCCGADSKLTIDHIEPLRTGSFGRKDIRTIRLDALRNPDKYQILCVVCNSSKNIHKECRLHKVSSLTQISESW